MSLLPQYRERLHHIIEKYTQQLTLGCRDAVQRLVDSEFNKDIYAFIIFVRAPHYYMNISINTEAIWRKGYGSVEDLDPYDMSLGGLRYDNIGYECDTHCEDVEAEMQELSADVFELVEDRRIYLREATPAEAEAEALLTEMQDALQDIAVNAILNTDFSSIDKTRDFAALVINFELDYAEQAALAKRTLSPAVLPRFDSLFPELQRREPKGLDKDITTLPDAQKAAALVQFIIDHHLTLNHYEASNRFAELLEAEIQLIQLRPMSDPYIAAAIDEYGTRVKAYEPGSAEAESLGLYNKEFYLINALLDMAAHSKAPISAVLESALRQQIRFLQENMSEDDARSMSLYLYNALRTWPVA